MDINDLKDVYAELDHTNKQLSELVKKKEKIMNKIRKHFESE